MGAVYGTDYKARICGVDEGLENRVFTAYPRIIEDYLLNLGVRCTAPTRPLVRLSLTTARVYACMSARRSPRPSTASSDSV